MEPPAKTARGVHFAEIKAGRFVLGFVTLDRPRFLNALDLETLLLIGDKLLEWRIREELAAVVLHADSEKAFCSGGDVKELAARLRQDGGVGFAEEYFTAEYFTDYLIHVYPKPVLCWADGITMGGGIGIMNGASCRAVTERSLFAMPEVALGLFPDAGATYFFNRLPAGVGLFLSLTGARFDGFDAVALGLAEGVVRSTRKKAVFAELARLPWTDDANRNKRTLRRCLESESDSDPAGKSRLLKRLDEIQKMVDHAGMEEIDAAFRSWNGKDEWLRRALQGYFSGSPTSAKTAYEQLKRGKRLGVKQAFLREWDMALNFCAGSDLREGVRALLVEKDRRPRWNPPVLGEVRSEKIDRYFSRPPGRVNLLRRRIAESGIS